MISRLQNILETESVDVIEREGHARKLANLHHNPGVSHIRYSLVCVPSSLIQEILRILKLNFFSLNGKKGKNEYEL